MPSILEQFKTLIVRWSYGTFNEINIYLPFAMFSALLPVGSTHIIHVQATGIISKI